MLLRNVLSCWNLPTWIGSFRKFLKTLSFRHGLAAAFVQGFADRADLWARIACRILAEVLAPQITSMGSVPTPEFLDAPVGFPRHLLRYQFRAVGLSSLDFTALCRSLKTETDHNF